MVCLLAVVMATEAQQPRQGGRRGRQSIDASALQAETLVHTDVEKRIMAVLEDLDENHRHGNMNVPVEDGRLLRLLTETTHAKNVVEIGTSNGYSGLWFLMALQKTGGHLTTYEIDRDRADQAIANFKRAGVENDVTLIFGDAHRKLAELKLDGPIDILFLDADKEGYIDYLKQLLPKVRPGGLVVAHNMNTRQAHPPFVEAITSDPALETLFLHMDQAGVAVTMKKR
jgi:predicted O-methyltransferase YrrM